MNDEKKYEVYLESKMKDQEELCIRCGACCGAYDNDPCKHLKQDSQGLYYCEIYDERFGMHYTVNGTLFKCIPIRNKLSQQWPGDEKCGYKKKQG